MQERLECYSITVDAAVRTKDELFSRITDTVYLGYSSFSGWDAFHDAFWLRLKDSNIHVEIANRDLSGLSEADRATYARVLTELVEEFPNKLQLV